MSLAGRCAVIQMTDSYSNSRKTKFKKKKELVRLHRFLSMLHSGKAVGSREVLGGAELREISPLHGRSTSLFYCAPQAGL